jgi:1-deoxyxylulose-5-phosphate synthase
VIARGPVAKGLLSSKPAAAFQDYSLEEVAKVQRGLESLTNPQRSKGQIAIRFALSHPAVAVSIPGSSRIEQLEENVGSSNVALTENELEQLRKLSKATVYELHR